MQWEDREESENVDDRRRKGPAAGVAIGGVGGMIVVVVALLMGVDPRRLLNPPAGAGPAGQQQGQPDNRPVDPEEERQAKFSKVIFHDTEVVWDELFRQMGRKYVKPKLVLFTGRVSSACGLANSAVGPFYCGGDDNVYIDLDFYRDMQRKLNAPGEFARAYVLAHEVGHHVQHLLGYSERVQRTQQALGKTQQLQQSVRLELQADYLAGVWAHHAQKKFHFLEKGDVETAMNAAFQIGDDRLQKKAQGYVVPDAFTHGTSKQRMRWFQRGLETGDVNAARALFDLDYKEL